MRAEAAQRLGAAAAQLASDGTGAAWKAAHEAEDRAAVAERRGASSPCWSCGQGGPTQAELDALLTAAPPALGPRRGAPRGQPRPR